MFCPNPNNIFIKDKYCPKCGSNHLIPSTDKMLCLECEWEDNQNKVLNQKGLRKKN